jgi:hypothetical protein
MSDTSGSAPTSVLHPGILRRGEITCSVRIWPRPHVKFGNRYGMDEGQIQVESIKPISLPDITGELARESGFLGGRRSAQGGEAGQRREGLSNPVLCAATWEPVWTARTPRRRATAMQGLPSSAMKISAPCLPRPLRASQLPLRRFRSSWRIQPTPS